MKVLKRDKTEVKFDLIKIINAIHKAMLACGLDKINDARMIAIMVEEKCFNSKKEVIEVKEIEKLVYEMLIDAGYKDVARAYEGYRAVQEFKRKSNTIDTSLTELIQRSNDELKSENANKDTTILSTARDYIAGEVSKDFVRRKLMPANLVMAHDTGAIHYHDMDFGALPFTNCCLIPIAEMLEKGVIMNKRLYETPATFEKACGITAQLIAQVTSNQYGGNSVNVKHLAKYLDLSKKRIENEEKMAIMDYGGNFNQYTFNVRVKEKLKEVCRAGVRSLLWQINGFSTLSGQSPFVTLFLEIEPDHELEDLQAMIVEQIIEERHIGMKNENGVYISPAFPKLVFVLDENNVHKDSKYYHIKRKALKCSAKRLAPDYVSAKKMREIYEGNVFSMMGCRSFLSPWKDENGNYKFEGRGNLGVVTLNLPQIALYANGDEEEFDKLLDARLELCYDALMFRYNFLKDAPSDVSPIHWQHGVLGRLKKGEKIGKLFENGYLTISLGYIGLYETTKVMKGVSHTTPEGEEFAVKVMKKLKATVDRWKEETGIAFGLYGTPSESLCHRFAKIDREIFGVIEDVTDKEYYTNSYHVDVREEIDAFSKLTFESQFQSISTGGCISYVEVGDLKKNIDAIEQIVDHGYETTSYFELNTKSDYCYECGYDGEMQLKDETTWYCPNCDNDNFDRLHVVRRTCGYIGENGFNRGKTLEISKRVLHI